MYEHLHITRPHSQARGPSALEKEENKTDLAPPLGYGLILTFDFQLTEHCFQVCCRLWVDMPLETHSGRFSRLMKTHPCVCTVWPSLGYSSIQYTYSYITDRIKNMYYKTVSKNILCSTYAFSLTSVLIKLKWWQYIAPFVANYWYTFVDVHIQRTVCEGRVSKHH